MKIYWWFFCSRNVSKEGGKPQHIFVCLYLFIISNNSSIIKCKIKNDMDEIILVFFCFRKISNLSAYLYVFFCSSATIVTFQVQNWMRWMKIYWWFFCSRNVSKKVANLTTYLCAFICSSSATLVTSPSYAWWVEPKNNFDS